MNATRKSLPALFAGVLATALAASAAEQTLPTPPPGGFPDTESSVNVPLPDWPDLGRRVTLTLSAHATPSNCVQIAFGRDANGDENLEPEGTRPGKPLQNGVSAGSVPAPGP